MNRNIFIAVLDNNHTQCLDDSIHSISRKKEFTIIKIDSRLDLETSELIMQIKPMSLVYKSCLIYSIAKKEFVKNRFSVSENNDTVGLPKSIIPLFNAIIDISNFLSMNLMMERYNRSLCMEALYLTDKIRDYSGEFDMTEYQLIKLKYGKQIHSSYLNKIVKDYPEKLI